MTGYLPLETIANRTRIILTQEVPKDCIQIQNSKEKAQNG